MRGRSRSPSFTFRVRPNPLDARGPSQVRRSPYSPLPADRRLQSIETAVIDFILYRLVPAALLVAAILTLVPRTSPTMVRLLTDVVMHFR